MLCRHTRLTASMQSAYRHCRSFGMHIHASTPWYRQNILQIVTRKPATAQTFVLAATVLLWMKQRLYGITKKYSHASNTTDTIASNEWVSTWLGGTFQRAVWLPPSLVCGYLRSLRGRIWCFKLSKAFKCGDWCMMCCLACSLLQFSSCVEFRPTQRLI